VSRSAPRTSWIPEGVIRFVYVTDLSVGRNPEKCLRVLDALQTDELCPCNWKQGDDTLKAPEQPLTDGVQST
jgi:alkyl hydroperoxide reductase subunit AhpC